MNPSKALHEAITAYRCQRTNEKYLGTGLLDLSEDHPSETKRAVKAALKKKYGYSGFLVALIAKDSPHHETATTMLKKHGRANFHTLWECVTEAGHFLNNQGRN
ncbi:hypothetical protein FK216_03400 [Moraxellaceae bacterium AER2_44_116]|nr:hypothetical protein [Moraxellaceae bacterium]TQC99292.1 hypothetical protein FK216_03400 [Moraxellaceae bacterium AER2_44_116]